ncbi:MAG TPA: hypothetical protein VGV87_09505 [Blastocatellia bacterium]|jgi:hypothetical protein|nr:hypothetical protein [Blastocatellia bacterium]
MASEQVEIIMTQVQQLSPDDRLELLNRLREWLDPSKEGGGRSPVPDAHAKEVCEAVGLVYGKYRNTGRAQSTEDDFRSAEWHPTEEELNAE